MTLSCTEVLQRGSSVEVPSTPERPAVSRSVDFRKSAGDGIGLDGKRKYQSIH